MQRRVAVCRWGGRRTWSWGVVLCASCLQVRCRLHRRKHKHICTPLSHPNSSNRTFPCLQVRCRLRHLPGVAGGSGSQLPELEAAQGRELQETDERGRAFLGDLSVTEGSGGPSGGTSMQTGRKGGCRCTTLGACKSSGLPSRLETAAHPAFLPTCSLCRPCPTGCASSGAFECELVCEALGLYPSSSHELESDGDGWAVCWSCPVLFSDDAAKWVERVLDPRVCHGVGCCKHAEEQQQWAPSDTRPLGATRRLCRCRFAHIERLNQQRGELVQRRDELGQRLGGAQHALSGAQKEQQQVQMVRWSGQC